MILSRSFDVAHINEVINHPEVRPFIGGDGEIDITPAVIEKQNVFLMGEHGGFMLAWSAPNVHEIHTFILPSGRGSWAREAAQELIAFCRKNGDRMIWTKVPKGRKNVEAFTRRAGLKATGEEVTMFGHPYSLFSLEFC